MSVKRIIGVRICPVCQTQFTVYDKSAEQKHCSPACGFAARSARKTAPAERFWRHVDKTPTCWLWTAATNTSGYGQFSVVARRDSRFAHRYAWELASGQTLTPDEAVLHTCDTPGCVRNDSSGTYEVAGVLLPRFGHLFLGTHMQNTLDKRAKHREAHGEGHGMAKLTESEVRLIRALRASGTPAQNLASQFGISYSHVYDIVSGNRWRHVT